MQTTAGPIGQSDDYNVSCVVKGQSVPCQFYVGSAESQSLIFSPGTWAGGNSDPANIPDPCNQFVGIEKGGIKNIARSPGDENTGNYYVLYTDWCPGNVVWYDGNRKLTQLTVGPFTSAKSFNYECTLSNGQVCKSSYTLPIASQTGGGRLAATSEAVSKGVSDNCSSQISLATASAVFYSQLLCSLSNLIQTTDDAQTVLSSLKQQLSGTAVVFSTDLTTVINALLAHNCQQAAQLLASANGSAMIDDEVFNSTINSLFTKI
ncbi:hypothetical protein M0L20_02610 [Spirosoma sp. RP8]|uniref:Ig-like domain-containing protein n=1 Tax=Spirosoma liriopis TaxID=2937440 RepID=A0ABT0HEZ2_9BACT|nr:hypothetical protein [Spirosoma liriopis]MCK8490726.1 hypothetical protein [Spirosoma liriopis]